MGRRLVSVVGRVKGGPARGGTTRQIRFWDDEALSIASTVYARSSGGTVIAQPVIPNAGKQVFLTADRAAGDAFVIVTDISPFSLGQIIPIFDAVNTVYKVITVITPATKRLDLDQTLGFAFTAATTKVNAPDMEGHIWGWLDDATDHFGQVTETATNRKGPPLEFPTAVPLASIAVYEEAVLAGTRPAINFIGRGATATDNGGANRIDVTIGILGGSTAANPGLEKTTETTTGLYSNASAKVGVAGIGLAIAEFLGVASAVNYVEFHNSTTGTLPYIQTAGSDSVISHELRAKGNGASVYLTQAGQPMFQAIGIASMVNYITATGSITANAPAFAPVGTDGNIDLYIRGKGTGGIGLATHYTDVIYVVGGTGSVTESAIGGSATIAYRIQPKGAGSVELMTNGSGHAFIGTNGTDYIDFTTATGVNKWTAAGASANIDIDLVPKGTGILKYKGAGLAPGNGVTITTAEASLGSDVTITTAGTFYDGASVSLAAGTWFVLAQATISGTASNGFTNAGIAKLWDGTTVEASGETAFNNDAAAGPRVVTITLIGIVSPGGTTTYKISCTLQQTGAGTGLIRAATPDSGSGNHATRIIAWKMA